MTIEAQDNPIPIARKIALETGKLLRNSSLDIEQKKTLIVYITVFNSPGRMRSALEEADISSELAVSAYKGVHQNRILKWCANVLCESLDAKQITSKVGREGHSKALVRILVEDYLKKDGHLPRGVQSQIAARMGVKRQNIFPIFKALREETDLNI